MPLTLYYGSGSPFAWRVQLALEHKGIPYERKVLSFSAGDTRTPEFVALNPRHRVPTIVDGGFVLYESSAIVEYLDEAYPGRGQPLFPGDAQVRAKVRRLVCEVDDYFYDSLDTLTTQAFQTKAEARDPAAIEKGCADVREEFALFTRYLVEAGADGFLAGPLSAADFTLYPLVATIKRCEVRLNNLDSDALLTPELRAWKKRIEALPYLAATFPPHWQAK